METYIIIPLCYITGLLMTSTFYKSLKHKNRYGVFISVLVIVSIGVFYPLSTLSGGMTFNIAAMVQKYTRKASSPKNK